MYGSIELPPRERETAPAARSACAWRFKRSVRLAVFVSGTALAYASCANPAQAQPTSIPSGQTGALGVGGAPATPSQSISPNANVTIDDAFYRQFSWKNDVVIFPPVSQTLSGDLGGFRKTLADYGIGYNVFNSTLFSSNVLHSEKNTGREQIYSGQQPTALTSSLAAVTVDLRRFGIPDGQIVVAGYQNSTSWTGLGPNTTKLSTLSYFQSAFNDHVEIKIGLLNETYEFIGQFVAGNVTSTFGPLAALGLETGQSGSFQATWGANVKFKFLNGFYDKLGVARSTNPDGPVLENQLNPTALNFTTRNSGGWFINEFGYRVPPTPAQNAIWLRAGASDTNARYVNRDYLTGVRSGGNYQVYALGDYQFLKLSGDPKQSYRGLYVGGSVQVAQSNLNPFYNYYEARLYSLGPFDSRPYDLVSLVVTDNQFSKQLVHTVKALHGMAHASSQTITAAYSAQIIPGVYGNFAAGYTNNPTVVSFTSKTGSALNLTTGLGIYF